MRAMKGKFVWLVGLLTICFGGVTVVRGQQAGAAAPAAERPQMAEQAFQDIQVLRGIPVKEFMETMGFFAASLSLNCSDCHGEASGASWERYADNTPLKQTSRRMVLMVNALNQANFGGGKAVTCYTCHRGAQKPKSVPSLQQQYGTPPDDDPDEITPLAAVRSTMTAEQILDRYLQAIGGAAAAKLTSYTAKGTYEGFDSDFEKAPVEVHAKAPDMRATVIHMRPGDVSTITDGRQAWSAGPADLTPVTLIPLVGDAFNGARLDAQLAFPAQIKQVLTDWRTGFPALTIDGKPVDVIEGRLPNKAGVKLYFEKQSGLLVRSVRYSYTKIGTVPITVVYSNYKEVPGLGVKMPYTWEVIWTNGRGTYNVTELQANSTIDNARFGRPTPPAQARR